MNKTVVNKSQTSAVRRKLVLQPWTNKFNQSKNAPLQLQLQSSTVIN
jgi:hypothetical protein